MQELGSALAVIRRAIHSEIAGQRFYQDASFYCVDLWAKEVFAGLAREEERHTQLLLVEHQALERSGQWIELDAAMASGVQVDITAFTFPEGEPADELFPTQRLVGESIDRRMDDLAALAFGIQLEQKAIALYGQEASRATESAAQQAYQFLGREETRHYHLLKSQWERLAGRPFQEA